MGQQENAASAVPSPRFSRREDARLCRVAQVAKLSDDVGKSQIEMAFDVLAEHPYGLDFVNDAGDLGPHMPRILFAAPSAGVAEGLAWIAG